MQESAYIILAFSVLENIVEQISQILFDKWVFTQSMSQSREQLVALNGETKLSSKEFWACTDNHVTMKKENNKKAFY